MLSIIYLYLLYLPLILQIKHGESAYPRDAWVEMQYNTVENNGNSAGGLPANFVGHTSGGTEKEYNDANKMFTAMSALKKHSVESFSGVILSNVGENVKPQANGATNQAFELN